MAGISYSGKQVLIVDDVADMRTALRGQVASLGLEKISVAGTVRDALERIKEQRFDIILCDYYLGGNTDGQQLLEYLRTSRIISRATLFVMVTAESGYESVITAAECLPDDYLLKPFTADTLRARFDRLLEKKERLARIDRLQDQGRWTDIIAACDEIMAASDKYLIDAMRIKGNALIATGRHDEARQLYQSAIALRPMPWARLGLARALRGLGDTPAATEVLETLVRETPTFLSAYDVLGQIHMEDGAGDAALQVLDQACNVSPNSLTRHRSIATIAEETGDLARVEKALSLVVQKTRNSPLRNSSDYARLGTALTELGEPARAVGLIDEAKLTFRDKTDSRLLAAVEAVAQERNGNAAAARQALDRALEGGTGKLPEHVALAVAKACLVHDMKDQATDILTAVVQNNPDARQVHARVSNVLKAHGGEEVAKRLIEKSVRQIIELNNTAVAKAKAGEFALASGMLTEAAARLPDNLQIVANAAYCLLLDIHHNGFDAERLKEAMALRQSLLERNASHPKLADIADVLGKIRVKYGAGATP
jgi:CheY-like chemotaxis protein